LSLAKGLGELLEVGRGMRSARENRRNGFAAEADELRRRAAELAQFGGGVTKRLRRRAVAHGEPRLLVGDRD
jgi:hypothetical protein